MSTKWKHAVIAAGLVGCRFDPGGVVAGGADAGGSGADAAGIVDAAAAADAAPAEPDAFPVSAGMTYVPGGSYAMGCWPGDACEPAERPVHFVVLSPFEIDVAEVTRAQYAACVSEGACEAPACDWSSPERPDHPVACVSWDQARTYCEWRDKALPSEAQWEIAARGASQAVYPWGNDGVDCERANFSACGGSTIAVGSLPAGDSAAGAHDMAGNLWEWVGDWYDPDYYAGSPTNDPTGPTGCDLSFKVIRGGGFSSPPSALRAAARGALYPWAAADDLGFRCARPVPGGG